MTPPLLYRNPVLGTSIPTLGDIDTAGAMERLGRIGQVSQMHRATQVQGRDRAATQMITQGHRGHGEGLDRLHPQLDLEGLNLLQEGWLEDARRGEREKYFLALQLSFPLFHRSLGNAAGRPQAGDHLFRFIGVAREYSQALRNNAQLRPEDRFRYLFAVSQIGRTLLGRLNAEAGELPNRETLRRALTGLMVEIYDQLLSHHQALVAAAPAGEHYTGILRQVQMRRALLRGETEEAQRRAREALSYYRRNPPPPPPPGERGRWDHIAGIQLTQDGELARWVGQTAVPAPAESTSAVINGVGYELLQIAAATIDMSNEDPETEIRDRYTALALAVSVQSLTRPGMSLREILEGLRVSGRGAALRAELETAARGNPGLNLTLTQALGHGNISQLVSRIQAAAQHCLEISRGPGQSLMGPILERNAALNPIARLRTALAQHRELAGYLGFRPDARSPLDPNAQLAIELLRRGPAALDDLRHYAASQEGRDVSPLIAILEGNTEPGFAVNRMTEELMTQFQSGLGGQPDHVVAAANGIFQVLSQTRDIAEGISLNSELRTRAQNQVEEMEGFWFRADRIRRHLTSPASVLTLLGGAVFAELLPSFLVARAGAEGRLAVRGIELVNAGRLTGAGTVATGVGTGLAISTISTALHNWERSGQGLRTHVGRDLALNSAINVGVFGLTMPVARWWGRTLTPSTEDAAAIGRLTGWRRFANHAGIAGFGTVLGWGAGFTWRGASTGQWTTSWDEVAENFLSMLAWELGAAGIRRIKQRFGLDLELRQIPVAEPQAPEDLQVAVTSGDSRRIRQGISSDGAGMIGRGRHRLARGVSGLFNVLFTNLGPHRAGRVQEIADRVVTEMIRFNDRNRLPNHDEVPVPENTEVLRRHRFWGVVARQIALQEIVSPGSLERYHDGFFAQYFPMIAGAEGSYRLVFLPSGNMRPVFEGIFMPTPPGRGTPEETAQAPRQPAPSGPERPSHPMSWCQEAFEAFLYQPQFQSKLEPLRQALRSRAAASPSLRMVELHLEFNPRTLTLALTPPGHRTQVIFGGEHGDMIPIRANFVPGDMTLQLPSFDRSPGIVELDLRTGTYRILPHAPPPPRGPQPPPGSPPPQGSQPPRGSQPPPPPAPPPPPPPPQAAARTAAEPGAPARPRQDAQFLPRIRPEDVGLPPQPPTPPPVSRGGYHGPRQWCREMMEYFQNHPSFISQVRDLRNQLATVPASWGNPPTFSLILNSENGSIRMERHVTPRSLRPGETQLIGIFYRDRGTLSFGAFEGQRGGVELNLATRQFQVRSPDSMPPPPTILAEPAPEGAPARPAREARVQQFPAFAVEGPNGPEATPVGRTVLGIRPGLEALRPGFRRTAISAHQPGNPRQAQDLFATSQGEVFAFTEAGFDKHGLGVNEDGYGVTVDASGRTVLMVADGMGGHSNPDGKSDSAGAQASAQAIQTVLDAAQNSGASLAQAFLQAHAAIKQAGHRGATCATAVRINPDGTVEVAQTGDTMVYILRPNPDGTQRVIRAFLPGNMAGFERGQGDLRTTVAMNAKETSAIATGGLGIQDNMAQITTDLAQGTPFGIYEGQLTVPAEGGRREPLRLQPGDGLLLVSDGIGDIFDSRQLATVISGNELSQAMGEALHRETMQHLDLFGDIHLRSFNLPPGPRMRVAHGRFSGMYLQAGGDIFDAPAGGNLVGHIEPLSPGQRVRIEQGSFSGMYIQAGGDIFDAPAGGNLVGHIHGDNVTALLFRYTGNNPTGTQTR